MYGTRMEANVAKGFLESEGIHAFVFVDDIGGSYPMVLPSGVALKVPSENVEKARSLLTLQK